MILSWFIHAFILILFSLFLDDSFLFIKHVCEVLPCIECIIIHHFQPVSHHHAGGGSIMLTGYLYFLVLRLLRLNLKQRSTSYMPICIFFCRSFTWGSLKVWNVQWMKLDWSLKAGNTQVCVIFVFFITVF